ncbi:hypothetical protein AB0C27_07985 [Nonomuraea sp. NPDC048882]|uniref:hypothetical protein n=1 Tax=Nonomuraea sp. NPDC048882 TaxID=3154347 RepID=UPI003408117F
MSTPTGVNDHRVTCPGCRYETRLARFQALLVGEHGLQVGCPNCRYSFWVTFH